MSRDTPETCIAREVQPQRWEDYAPRCARGGYATKCAREGTTPALLAYSA